MKKFFTLCLCLFLFLSFNICANAEEGKRYYFCFTDDSGSKVRYGPYYSSQSAQSNHADIGGYVESSEGSDDEHNSNNSGGCSVL